MYQPECRVHGALSASGVSPNDLQKYSQSSVLEICIDLKDRDE